MSGLSLRTGLGAGGGISASTGDTVSQAAYGPGATTPTSPGDGLKALAPTKPFGLALWVSVASVVGLVVIRHSLPR